MDDVERRGVALKAATEFVYGYNVARDKTTPILRARDALNVAEIFDGYLQTGEIPAEVAE